MITLSMSRIQVAMNDPWDRIKLNDTKFLVC